MAIHTYARTHAAQVLVATSTLAWGVNTPAHLVIIKGTEYYDAPSRRYVDFPITDVLQVGPPRPRGQRGLTLQCVLHGVCALLPRAAHVSCLPARVHACR